jgi:hypothetical protein
MSDLSSFDFDQIPPLRFLEATVSAQEGQKLISLFDPTGYCDGVMNVSPGAFYILTLLSEKKSLATLLDEIKELAGATPPVEDLKKLILQADEACMLDNDRFQQLKRAIREAFMAQPTRLAAFAGKSYPEDPTVLRETLDELLDGPMADQEGGAPKAIVVPHIDFRVGAELMAAGWRQVQNSDAELFIILGTGHSLVDDFVAGLDKDFETPVGTMPTDHEFMALLQERFGESIYNEAEAHRVEHSVEFAALFMAHMFGDDPSKKAAPILLSFPESVWELDHPRFNGERIERFVTALKETIAVYGKKVMFVASVDFAHIGHRFGDEGTLTDERLKSAEAIDRTLLDAVEEGDMVAFADTIKRTNRSNRVCGFPALYMLLGACDAKGGITLGYKQNIEGERESMVSFAAMTLS